MNVSHRHRCVTCNRIFPDGQGIIIKIGDETLEFHSSKCFAKFTKSLLERIPYNEIKGYVKKIREEFEEVNEQKKRLKAKKIV